MPPKRAAPQETQAETQTCKRYRQAIDEVAEEYVCPITAELPIDPVIAEDGRCYERCAIEEWFARQPQAQVKSPLTNELMGKRLLPAVQVRNTLKRLVESGAISGSKADAWKKAVADEAKVAILRVMAEGGDADAMRLLGLSCRDGMHGLKKDLTQSFTWLKRAADLKDVRALSSCGVAYLNGEGVKASVVRGIAMVGAAATMGSEHACGILGQANAEGLDGFEKDPQEATTLYREMQKCDQRNSDEETRERAAVWLRVRAPVRMPSIPLLPHSQHMALGAYACVLRHTRVKCVPFCTIYYVPCTASFRLPSFVFTPNISATTARSSPAAPRSHQLVSPPARVASMFFIASIVGIPSILACVYWWYRSYLAPNTQRPTIACDMDEVLCHTELEPRTNRPD